MGVCLREYVCVCACVWGGGGSARACVCACACVYRVGLVTVDAVDHDVRVRELCDQQHLGMEARAVSEPCEDTLHPSGSDRSIAG